MYMGLIHSHALSCKTGRIIDRDGMQIRMLLPVRLQDEQQLLRRPESKHGQQHMSTTPENRMYERRKPQFLFGPRLKGVHAVGAFDDEHVGSSGRDFCLHQVMVFFARVVASV